MKRFRPYIIAVGIVAVWAAFAYRYLGVEDGSSGLSPLGWICGVFFIPGGLLLSAITGTRSNADLPAMSAFSFCMYAVIALLVTKGVTCLGRAVHRGEPNEAISTDA